MLKWFNLFGGQYVGFWIFGIMLLILQEVPYIIMPLFNLQSNPIMDMRETFPVLNMLEKALGVFCIAAMSFIVEEKAAVFEFGSGISKIGFVATVLILLANYFGWVLYFSGYQTIWVMLVFIVALPPLYYAAIGLWRRNWILLASGVVFGIVHFMHVYGNLTAQTNPGL